MTRTLTKVHHLPIDRSLIESTREDEWLVHLARKAIRQRRLEQTSSEVRG